MPSEKAKENKTLVATCRACGRPSSTEILHGLAVLERRRRTIIPVCEDCRRTGWKPPAD